MSSKIPELSMASVTKTLDEYCKKKVPGHLKDQIKLSWQSRSNTVTLVESRPTFFNPKEWYDRGVAQFRFENSEWHLYCADRNEKWHRFDPEPANKSFEKVLAAVDRDDTGIFWG